LNVPDVVSSDTESLQVDGVSVFDDHLDGLEVSVHGHVYAGDGAVNLGPVLQLDRDRLVRELHQESEVKKDENCLTTNLQKKIITKILLYS
jgi:hypothetical protein